MILNFLNSKFNVVVEHIFFTLMRDSTRESRSVTFWYYIVLAYYYFLI